MQRFYFILKNFQTSFNARKIKLPNFNQNSANQAINVTPQIMDNPENEYVNLNQSEENITKAKNLLKVITKFFYRLYLIILLAIF